MHWPKIIDTREMLTKETPPNTFLMVRFKFCFSVNIVTVIQFVLKVFFSFSLSTVGTTLMGEGVKYQKKKKGQGNIK